jgi:GNAT superfamily N-acetyltransferase
MSTELQIREVRPDDLPRLQELYAHLHASDLLSAPDEAVAILQQLLLYRGSAILVGAIGSALVTSCTLVVVPNLTRGGTPYALIENVVTHADWRKRGFGSVILNVAAQRAWDHGCYKVMLMTGSKNPATLGFYVSAGFEQTKTGFQMRRPPL